MKMGVATIVRVFSVLSWLLVFASIGFAVYAVARRGRTRLGVGMIAGAVVVAILLSTVSSGLVFIQPQERGVVISALQPNGYRTQALQPGLRWIIPFFESVERYSIARETYTMSQTAAEGQLAGDDSIAARTADGQEVFIDASVIYSINPARVVDVHIIWQSRFTDGLIRPQTRGVIRDVASQFGVEEIYSTRRQDFTAQVEAQLTALLDENGLMLNDFVLRNITFTPEYAASIEQKQIAEQEVQRAVFVVQQRQQEAEQLRAQAQGLADAAVIAAEGEAQAILIEAEAQSEALRLLGEGLASNPDLVQYTYVQNLSDNVELMLVPANSPYLFPLPETGTVSSPTGGSER
jgi:regulator of protease activity HflC (stomatin/prohibitin superfamily)